MTLQSLYYELLAYKTPILIAILVMPWLAYGVCKLIPGRKEEPYVLSVNLALSLILLVLLLIYLIYAFSGRGFAQLVEEADLLLLIMPIYHVLVSLWLSKKCIPLEDIPASHWMKGLGMIAVAFAALMWIASKIRILFFSFLPFSTFLYIVGGILLFGLLGIKYLRGKK